ncbi:MAG: autotransporter domain-containing protein, partial [Chlamydiae bacterium]|nr:autotransporter domain-containing protein [Chlamydiota bacterium]
NTIITVNATSTLIVNNSLVKGVILNNSSTLQFGRYGIAFYTPILTTNPVCSIDTQAYAEEITGVISGSGFTKIGSGSLILTNSNTYSGTTTVTGGLLQISRTNNLGTAPGVLLGTSTTLQISANIVPLSGTNIQVALNGTATIDTQPYSLTLVHPITGNQALNKNGAGTLTLSTSNQLASTTVNQGTLAINDGTVGNLNLGVNTTLNVLQTSILTASQTVTLAGSNTIRILAPQLTIQGTLQGTGPLINAKGGILTLTGANTYNGGTQIISSALQIEANNNLGADGTTLALNGGRLQAIGSFTLSTHPISLTGACTIDTQGFNVIDSSVISGAGSLYKAGTGTFTFQGINTYSGATLIQAGKIAVNANGLIPNTPVAISLPGSLDISGANSSQTIDALSGSGSVIIGNQQLSFGSDYLPTTFSGSFTGAGTLIKKGSQTITLSGQSTGYSGTLNITRGEIDLVNNASLLGNVNVQVAGILSGSGTVGNLQNLGTVSPGNSIGTIVVAGNYSQTSTGVLDIEVDSITADLIAASGTANLAGLLAVTPLPGTYLKGQTFTIVSGATGLLGTWDSNNLSLLPVNFGIQYLPFEANLVVLENNIFFGRDIKGFNPNSTANYLDFNVPGSDTPFIDILTDLAQLDSEQLTDALNTMHPAQMGAIRQVRQSQASMITQMFSYRAEELCCQRLETAPVCAPTALWVEPYDQFLRIDTEGLQKGFNANTAGVAIGADHCFSSGVAIGLASGYSHTDLNWFGEAGKSTMHSVFAGVYSDWIEGPFSLYASAIGAKDHFAVTRHIFYPGFSANAKSKHAAWEYDVHLGTGYDFPIRTWQSQTPSVYMRPFVNFDYFRLSETGFKEKGAGILDLNVYAKDSQFVRSQLGVQLSRSMTFSKGCWSPSLWLSYINIYSFSDINYESNFVGLPSSFIVHSFPKMWSLFSPGFDFSVNFNSGLILIMKYQAEFNGTYMIQSGNLRFEWSF